MQRNNKFADDTKLKGALGTAIQRDLRLLEEQVNRNFSKLKESKC